MLDGNGARGPSGGQQQAYDARWLSNTALSCPIVVFFLTAPHDHPDRGDTDYVKSVLEALRTTCVTAVHVTGEMDGRSLYDFKALYKDDKFKNLDSDIRKEAVENILSYAKGYQADNKIFHLQLRAPETGCMIHPQELSGLKEAVSKFVITCHEWIQQSNNQERIKQLEYIKYADRTIFLNEADKRESEIENSVISNVTATIPTNLSFDVNAFLRRPANILIFGLIRKDKGFEEGIKIAEELAKISFPIRVVFAGKPYDLTLSRKLIKAKYSDEAQDFGDELKIHQAKELTKYQSELARQELKKLNIDQTDLMLVNDKQSMLDVLEKHGLSGQSRRMSAFYRANLPKELREKITTEFYSQFSYQDSTIKEKNPIDLHFDVDGEKLDELAKTCKYYVKLEKKGFANNSSSIINALCRYLIVFSYKGELTNDAFINGKYKDAMVLLEKKDGEKALDYVQEIISTIDTREKEPQEANRASFEQLKDITESLFCLNKIKVDHINVYQNLLESRSSDANVELGV
ncbi:MAG: hypothetical protein K0R73_1065 [Candidatus Midichloriaceae bacterium]|jgi:hypothetical protein|nr:hypothetical protein [Candidatus Midichloriaceae bacterium]